MNPERRPAKRRTGRRQRQGGFALLLVFVMAAMVAVALYRELPRVAFQAHREREELLIERGEQYKRAVKVFYRQFQRYPPTLEALENTNNIRFLRKRFKDPMTGKDEWRLVEASSLAKKQQGKKGNVGKSVEEIAQEQQGGGGASNQARRPWDRTRPSDLRTYDPQSQQNNTQPDYTQQQTYNPAPPSPENSTQEQNAAFPGQEGQPGDPTAQNAGQQPVDPNQPVGPGQPMVPGQPGQTGPVVVQQPAFPWQQQGQPGQQPGQQQPGQPGYQPGSVLTPGGQPGPAQNYPQIPGQAGDPNYQPGTPVIDPNTGQPESYGQRMRRQMGQAGAVPGSQPPDPNNPSDPYNPQRRLPPPAPAGGGVGGNPTGTGRNDALGLINQQLTNPPQQTRMGQNSPFAAGGIVGVASKSEDEGIKRYKERSKYKEWEFVYDPTEEMAAGMGLPGMNQNPAGQRGGSGTGQNPSGQIPR